MKRACARKHILSLFFLGLLFPGFVLAQNYVPGQVIIKLRKNSYAGGVQAVVAGKMMGQASLKADYPEMNLQHYNLKDGVTVEQVMQQMQSDPNIEYIEPNYILRKVDDAHASDTQAYSQSDVEAMSGGGTFSQNYAAVKVTESWSIMSASSAVVPVVAIVDTGVDYNHHIFVDSGAMWANSGEIGTDSGGHDKRSNGVDDDGNGYVDDYRGWNFHAGNNNPMDDDNHGTHVAGIVLGVGQDIFATTMDPAKIRIMPLKFLGADGSGSTSDAINAIYYAARNGANVINNSWGGSNYSQSLHDALAYAYSRKLTIAAAAGNYSSNNDVTAMYPSNYPVPSLIAVASTTDSDGLSSFSNYGRSLVHVAAPGSGILSSVPGNAYQYLSGTSMATPFVAGMAALIYREAPNLTGYQIKSVVTSSVNVLSGLSSKVSSSGRVNAYNSVNIAKSQIAVASSQPSYVANGISDRAPSSAKAGCGTVDRVYKQGSEEGAFGAQSLFVLLAFALPLLVWCAMRARSRAQAKKANLGRRQHERFVMNSEIQVKVGDRQLSGQMKTISEGGLSFDAEAMLEKGGILTMTITSPDGREQVEVQGRVVWSEQSQGYGVQFENAKEGLTAGIQQSIRQWTSGLTRAK